MVIKVKPHWTGLGPTGTTVLGTGISRNEIVQPPVTEGQSHMNLKPNSRYSNVLIKILEAHRHETGEVFQ